MRLCISETFGDLTENLNFTSCGGQSYKKDIKSIQLPFFFSYNLLSIHPAVKNLKKMGIIEPQNNDIDNALIVNFNA